MASSTPHGKRPHGSSQSDDEDSNRANYSRRPKLPKIAKREDTQESHPGSVRPFPDELLIWYALLAQLLGYFEISFQT